VFWLSYKKCNLAVFGVNRMVIEPRWSQRRDFGLTSNFIDSEG
jgi:hypothetical protein